MTIPTYEDFMLPLLRSIADGQEHRTRDLIQPLADALSVLLPEHHPLQPDSVGESPHEASRACGCADPGSRAHNAEPMSIGWRDAITEAPGDSGATRHSRAALVMIASRGLGRGCAEALAGVDYTLVVRSRNPVRVEERLLSDAATVSIACILCGKTTPS